MERDGPGWKGEGHKRAATATAAWKDIYLSPPWSGFSAGQINSCSYKSAIDRVIQVNWHVFPGPWTVVL